MSLCWQRGLWGLVQNTGPFSYPVNGLYPMFPDHQYHSVLISWSFLTAVVLFALFLKSTHQNQKCLDPFSHLGLNAWLKLNLCFEKPESGCLNFLPRLIACWYADPSPRPRFKLPHPVLWQVGISCSLPAFGITLQCDSLGVFSS